MLKAWIFFLSVLSACLTAPASKTEVEAKLINLDKLLSESPIRLNLIQPLASDLFEKKKYSEVIQRLNPKVSLFASDTLLILARSYHMTGDSHNEARVLKNILTKDPQNYQALTQIGYFYLKNINDKDRFKKANDAFLQAIQSNSKFIPAYNGLIEIYKQKDESESKYQIKNLYTDLIKIFGKKSEYLKELCRLNFEDSFFDVAIDYCQEGVRIDPLEPTFHVYLGLSIGEKENPQAGLKILEKTTRQFPKSDLAFFQLGKHLEQMGSLTEAEQKYKEAYDLNSNSIEHIIALTDILVKNRKFDLLFEPASKGCNLDNKKMRDHLRKIMTSIRLAGRMDLDTKFSSELFDCLPISQ